MKIFFTDQTKNFDNLLKEHVLRSTKIYSRDQVIEKISTIDLHCDKRLEDLDLGFFFNYKIFPPNILAYKTEWEAESREMKLGDTILQQAFIPPFKNCSLKVIFASRINSIIHEPTKKGFSYETIEGHVEVGESIFTIEQTAKGLIFKVHTYSKPGNVLTKLVGSIFTLPYQDYCTRKAMKNVKRQILKL